MVSYITNKGKDSLEKRLSEKLKDLKMLLDEKAHAYTASGDGWHDNPGWIQIGQKEEMMSKEIGLLQKKLATSKVIEVSPSDINKVQLGLFVTFKQTNIKTNKSTEMAFQLATDEEADIRNGVISVNSPIGKSLVGLKLNEKTTIFLPSGEFELQVLNIEFKEE